MAAESYYEAQTVFQKRHRAHWRQVSKKVDQWARILIAIGLYPLGLMFILSLDMRHLTGGSNHKARGPLRLTRR